jgi:ribose transport system permease protein
MRAEMNSLSRVGLLERLRRWSKSGESRLAVILFIVLVVVNVIINPARFAPTALGRTLGMMSPLILATIAVTIVFLSGGGSIDISVGPLMTLASVVIVKLIIVDLGITSPFAVIPIALFIGIASGFLNGFLAAIVHIQPIVATLGTYLIYSGVSLWIMPSPGGYVPVWMAKLSSSFSFLPIVIVFIIWWILRRTVFYEQLMATGGDDRAAYSSGVNVTAVRIGSYVFAGIFASIGAIALCALLGSADPKVGAGYTMTGIAGAALGGVSLAGGIGRIIGATFGAMDIFLLQSILTFFNVSPFAIRVAYGIILVFALVLDSPEISLMFRRLTGGVQHEGK